MLVQYGQVMIKCKTRQLSISDAGTGTALKVAVEGDCLKQDLDEEALQAYLLHPGRFLCIINEPAFRFEARLCTKPTSAQVKAAGDGFDVSFSAEAELEE